MVSERIAVCAMKGGVGKSVTSVNLAVGLARASWRVLLIDVDAQGNTTSLFSYDAEPDLDLYDVMARREPVRKAIMTTRINGLDLLPSSLAVARLDTELISMHRREYRMLEALDDVLNDYDAMVLDLPPSLSPLVISALVASSSFLVPTNPSRWGVRGLELLLSWASDLRDARVLEADHLGVVLTKTEAGTKITREIRAELLASDLPMFAAEIPKRTGAERMVANREVIGDDGTDEDINAAYAALTLEVIQRVNECRALRGRHSKGSE